MLYWRFSGSHDEEQKRKKRVKSFLLLGTLYLMMQAYIRHRAQLSFMARPTTIGPSFSFYPRHLLALRLRSSAAASAWRIAVVHGAGVESAAV